MALLRSDFSATYIPTAFDLRDELIDLNKLARRSSAAVTKQIENYIDTLYDTVKTGALVGTPPDATVPATEPLRSKYDLFANFTKAERIKIQRALSLADATEVKDAIAAQLQDFLEHRSWTFA